MIQKILATWMLLAVSFADTPKPSSFDATLIASLEQQIWQAYYDRRLEAVEGPAISYLVNLFALSEQEAREIAPLFLKSMEVFGNISIDASDATHEEKALPSLEAYFEKLAKHMPTGFDPKEVAKAELSWWMARRRASTRDIETVGHLMAHALGLMFAMEPRLFERAAYFRACAGRYRDKCKEWGGVNNQDWEEVRNILESGYKAWPPLQTNQGGAPCEPATNTG